jgi:2,4-dienoyl-CoA reductase-like NADH-dependent reductase (Old Yellow Enzyme family)
MKNNYNFDTERGHKEFQSGLSRRDFLKLSAAGALGAAALPSMTGCGPVVTGPDCVKSLEKSKAASSKKPFESSSIGSIKLKNRILRSAVSMNRADKAGRPSGGLLDHYRDIATGGAGAIITGMMDTGMMIDESQYSEEYFNDYKKVPDLIHKFNIPVIQQISHRGRQINLDIKNDFRADKLKDAEINDIINKFVEAIVISKRMGFDAVQLHGAHGYALSEFISPARNTREDRWGGSTEKRFTVIREIFQRAQEKVKDYPILIKINAYDNRRNGMRIDEAVRIASLLEKTGFAAVEVSCGVMDDDFSTVRVPSIPSEALLKFSKYGELPSPLRAFVPYVAPIAADRHEPLFNFNVCAAREISRNVKIPVIVVGGIRNIADIKTILASDSADYISMGRPFIIEPDIVNRFRKDAGAKSECINCGYCLIAVNSSEAKCYYGKL